jgi:mannitol/fructose-specific phosphotransferase system IIA component (Ntr-type)
MVPELQSRTAPDVIAELCSLLQRNERLPNSAAFYEAVMAREFLSPTSIPPAWALPHARLQGIAQLSFALARSSQPLVWFHEGGIRPQTVFLFAVPEGEARTYLSLVAAVARLNQNRVLLEQLRRAPDGKSMFKVLEQVHLREPRRPEWPAGVRMPGKLDHIEN